jgi:crotonobetainyl-CoA:carnitine CoA-transferase CaiB-like acyl-CoA transferase
MLDASLVMLTSLATPYLIAGQLLPRTGNTGYSGAPTAAIFMTRDGSRISLGVVQDNQFAALCRAIGMPELLDDPRFASVVDRAKPENTRELQDRLAVVFASRAGAEWERLLNSVGAPCGLVRDVAAACESARESGRRLLEPVDVQLPSGERTRGEYINAGFVFASDGPGGARSVPGVGEHTREVMKSLQYDEHEIDAMLAGGVIGAPPHALQT